ncbi:MAG: hypothetical protein KF729_19495 [Sandaracinaceae bacterium]|nr:hypothetical protein [Sandaracinaceae bacterium]
MTWGTWTGRLVAAATLLALAAFALSPLLIEGVVVRGLVLCGCGGVGAALVAEAARRLRAQAASRAAHDWPEPIAGLTVGLPATVAGKVTSPAVHASPVSGERFAALVCITEQPRDNVGLVKRRLVTRAVGDVLTIADGTGVAEIAWERPEVYGTPHRELSWNTSELAQRRAAQEIGRWDGDGATVDYHELAISPDEYVVVSGVVTDVGERRTEARGYRAHGVERYARLRPPDGEPLRVRALAPHLFEADRRAAVHRLVLGLTLLGWAAAVLWVPPLWAS